MNRGPFFSRYEGSVWHFSADPRRTRLYLRERDWVREVEKKKIWSLATHGTGRRVVRILRHFEAGHPRVSRFRSEGDRRTGVGCAAERIETAQPLSVARKRLRAASRLTLNDGKLTGSRESGAPYSGECGQLSSLAIISSSFSRPFVLADESLVLYY